MRVVLCIMVVLAFCTVACGDGWKTGLLTNEGTDQIEFRLGRELDETWEAGAIGRWFSEDVCGADWGAGAYLKMAVDPNGSIALKDWLPGGIGEWLSLPESLHVETYLLGKFLYAETPDDDPFSGAIGAGFTTGPVVLEILYNIVETGEADDPQQRSGMDVWFGAILEF